MIDRHVFERADFIAALLPEEQGDGLYVSVLKSRHTTRVADSREASDEAARIGRLLLEPMRLAAGVMKETAGPRVGSPGMTPEQIEAAHRYYIYLRGWRHGACASAKADMSGPTEHLREAYELGYEDGRSARAAAHETARQWTGHEPSVLRGSEQPGNG